MDRMDLFVDVPPLKYEKLVEQDPDGSSAKLRENIAKARKLQSERFANGHEQCLQNNEMDIPQIKKYCAVSADTGGLLRKYVDSGKLSARGYHRVLRTARTIADLDGSDAILYDHVSEALMYRTGRG